jgi:hypothetical protein
MRTGSEVRPSRAFKRLVWIIYAEFEWKVPTN